MKVVATQLKLENIEILHNAKKGDTLSLKIINTQEVPLDEDGLDPDSCLLVLFGRLGTGN